MHSLHADIAMTHRDWAADAIHKIEMANLKAILEYRYAKL